MQKIIAFLIFQFIFMVSLTTIYKILGVDFESTVDINNKLNVSEFF